MAIGLSGFSSGGGNPIVPDIEWVLTTSQSWSPPFKCKVLTFVIGAGGLAGKVSGTSANLTYCSSGGGAGGCSASILTLDPAVSYTATIGAGASHATSGILSGVDGGDTTFSGSDIDTMTGNGGGAGVLSYGGGTRSAAGGAGGTATNGNLFNATGGAGGNADNTGAAAGSSSGSRFAGGGGAVGILGEGHRGGHALSTTGSPTLVDCAAGGAGVGGRGGDLDVQRASGSAAWTSGGGGTYGPGADTSGNFSTASTAGGLGRSGDSGGSFDTGTTGILILTGAARLGNSGGTTGPTAGVGGEGQRTNAVYNAGIFAGGGGIVDNRSIAGDTFFGGGTGGHATDSTTSPGCKAGDGVVIIKLLEIIE